MSGSGPAGSPVVFVGTAEENRRGYTKLAVDEVWHGPDLAFTTNVCSMREVTGPTARRPERPAHPRAPDADGLDGAVPPAGPWTFGLGAAAVLPAGAGLVAWIRRRGRAWGTSTAT